MCNPPGDGAPGRHHQEHLQSPKGGQVSNSATRSALVGWLVHVGMVASPMMRGLGLGPRDHGLCIALTGPWIP
eukprot:6234772-Pyramimonas_sp.AAC.1